VRKSLPVLVAMLVCLHVGFGCGTMRGAAALEVPCCSGNCRMPVAQSGQACCQQSDASAATTQAATSKPVAVAAPEALGALALLLPPILIASSTAPPRHIEEQGAGTTLALLCSRQI
jgi:hypothetical protein